jgi:hypothetical protein
MRSGFYRSFSKAERLSRLPDGHLQEKTKVNHLTVFMIQVVNGPPQRFKFAQLIIYGTQGLLLPITPYPEPLNGLSVAAKKPPAIPDKICCDAEQPGTQGPCCIKTPERAVGADKGLLGNISGIILVTKLKIRQPEYSLLMLMDQIFPGGFIPTSRPDDHDAARIMLGIEHFLLSYVHRSA